MNHNKGFRAFQLIIMGFTAIFIGPVTMFTASVIHKYPMLGSISEGATIANKVSPILPYALGALSLFALSYSIKLAYDGFDRLVTLLIFVGFTAVAMQMCQSIYVETDGVGVLNLSPRLSDTVHNVGALTGFGALIVWVLVCFRKSDKPHAERTKQKHKRNRVYEILGAFMLLSLSLFWLDAAGLVLFDLPVVFFVECLILTFGGMACLIKGGLLMGDKI
jgi:hypothetical protein